MVINRSLIALAGLACVFAAGCGDAATRDVADAKARPRDGRHRRAPASAARHQMERGLGWINPFLGTNETAVLVEGMHADWYGAHSSPTLLGPHVCTGTPDPPGYVGAYAQMMFLQVGGFS